MRFGLVLDESGSVLRRSRSLGWLIKNWPPHQSASAGSGRTNIVGHLLLSSSDVFQLVSVVIGLGIPVWTVNDITPTAILAR